MGNRGGPDPMWYLVATALIVGMAFGGIIIYIYTSIDQLPSQVTKIHPAQNKFHYINPLLATEVAGKQSTRNSAFLLSLQGLVERSKKDGKITDASIYYRDIESGSWAGIDEGATFSPGKLLKIPIMITYYKLAETNPVILDQKLRVPASSDSSNDVLHTTRRLEVGKEYTVDQLIEAMIIDSDDRAADVLFDNSDKDQLNEIFSDLGISFKEDKGTQDFIPLKQYALFFRLLYNATYLNREYSEKALGVLIKTNDSVSLGSRVSRNVPLADMEGARSFTKDGKKRYEMYDCGIFYYPGHPYLLCVAVKGSSLADVGSFIGEVGIRSYTDTHATYK